MEAVTIPVVVRPRPSWQLNTHRRSDEGMVDLLEEDEEDEEKSDVEVGSP